MLNRMGIDTSFRCSNLQSIYLPAFEISRFYHIKIDLLKESEDNKMFTLTGIAGKSNSSQLREYTLDTPDDVILLPTQTTKGKHPQNTVDNDYCSTGSSAFIISTSQLFMLNSDGIWCEV
jgi:hypothetical protein